MASFGRFCSIDNFIREFPHYPILLAVLQSIINLQVSDMHTLFITPHQGQEFNPHIARHQTCP